MPMRCPDRLLVFPASEKRQRTPAFGVDHVGAAIRRLHVVTDPQRAAILLGVQAAKRHVAFVQHVVWRRTQQRHVHAHLRGDQQRGVRHGRVQRLGVPCPGQYVLPVPQVAQPLAQRQHVGQLLTWMGNGFQVDHRHRRVLCEGPDHPILPILGPVLEFRECPHRDQIDIARQHAGNLGHVLLGVAVHHAADCKLDGPGILARRQHDRMAAQLECTQLETRPRAHGWIEEQQRNRFSRQLLTARGTLERGSLVEQCVDLGATVILGGDEMAERHALVLVAMGGRAGPVGGWQSGRDETRTNKNPARWPGLFVDSHTACATAYPA